MLLRTPGRRVRKWNLPTRRTWMRPAASSSLMWWESVAAEMGSAARACAQPSGQAGLSDALEQLEAARVGEGFEDGGAAWCGYFFGFGGRFLSDGHWVRSWRYELEMILNRGWMRRGAYWLVLFCGDMVAGKLSLTKSCLRSD